VSAKREKLRVDIVARKHKSKVYTSLLLRRRYRKNGKVWREVLIRHEAAFDGQLSDLLLRGELQHG
jgi:hypothetical protein